MTTKYPTLPKMPHCNGCGDCCGPTLANRKDLQRIRDYLKVSKAQWVEHEDAAICGFYRPATGDEPPKCAIYPVRPFACRLFGVAREMSCPHFPEDATINFPPSKGQKLGLMTPSDELLCQAFAPDGGRRMLSAVRKNGTRLQRVTQELGILHEGGYITKK